MKLHATLGAGLLLAAIGDTVIPTIWKQSNAFSLQRVAGKFELTMTIAETTGTWVSLGFATNNTHVAGHPSIS